MECQFYTSLFNQRSKFEVQLRVVCTNDVEKQIFLKQISSLSKTLRGIVGEMPVYFGMPSNYTIDDVGAKYVVKTSGSEKIQVIVMLTELEHSMEPSTMCDSESKQLCLRHRCLTKGWKTK
jgi:hypothetical protein